MADSTAGRVGETFGPYRLESLLGRGGMGEVYRAHDTSRERDVALKLLTIQYAQDPTFQQRFRRECQTLARLDEPHVIPIHDFGEIDGTLFLDMRLVNGRDLRTILRERGSLPADEAVTIVEQVAAALDAAHAAGLVHRDIKPENVLVTGATFAYLVDFGVAHADTDTHLTRTGTAVGSVAYMSPEQFDNTPVTAVSDVYSLAAMFFELLTGRQPYPGDSISAVMRGVLFDNIPSAGELNPLIGPEMDAVLAWGLHKSPDQRCPNALELARAARAALSGESSPLPLNLTKNQSGAPMTVSAPSPSGAAPTMWSNSSGHHPTVVSSPQNPAMDPTMVGALGQGYPPGISTAGPVLSGPTQVGPMPSNPQGTYPYPGYPPSSPYPPGPYPPGPYPPGPYPPGPQPGSRRWGRTNTGLLLVLGILVAAIAGVGVWFAMDRFASPDDTADVAVAEAVDQQTTDQQATAPNTLTAAPTAAAPTYVPGPPPPDNQACPGATGVGTGYPQWTGCEFAINVRNAYVAGGPLGQSRTVNGWAPQQQKYYVMTCDPYAGIIACRGGNQAVVYVY